MHRRVGVEGVAFRLIARFAELIDHRLAFRQQARVGTKGHVHTIDVLRATGGGYQLIGHDAIVGHEDHVLEALLAQLANQRASLRVQAAEVDHVGTGATDLGHHGAEVLLATGQAFIQHGLDAAFFQLRLGGVSQALAVSVLVVQDCDFLALDHIDDVVTGHNALLVIAPAHAEHAAQAALGNFRVGRTGSDGNDAGFVIHLGSGDGIGRTEVADYADHLVLVDQTVGHRNGLLRLAGIVTLHQHDFFTVDAAGRIDGIGCCLRPLHVLLTKRCTWTRHWTCHTDLDVGLNKRSNAHCRSDGQRQKTFPVKRL
ncbi:hypothetical protein D3C80_911590 [compost metagenome]